jgi:putative peptide zinc metalloprotease protein
MPAILMISLNCVFSLNPIFKFDGYWIVADALGVANLSTQSRRIIKYYVQKVRGNDVSPLPWKTYTIVLLSIYAVVSICFWAWFLLFSLPVLLRHLVGYPAMVRVFFDEIFRWHSVTTDKIFSFLSATYIVLLVALIAYRLGKPWTLQTFYFFRKRLS